MMMPPSGAELTSAATPDNLRDLRTGVNGSPDPMSPEDTLLALLVGVKDRSSLRGVTCFRGVRCFGRADGFSGVVGVLEAASSESISAFLVDLLLLFGVSGFGLSMELVS